MEKYKVDSNVPLPEEESRTIPLNDLEIGQSILFNKSRKAYVQTKASRLKKKNGKVFTIRPADETHYRVWRRA